VAGGGVCFLAPLFFTAMQAGESCDAMQAAADPHRPLSSGFSTTPPSVLTVFHVGDIGELPFYLPYLGNIAAAVRFDAIVTVREDKLHEGVAMRAFEAFDAMRASASVTPTRGLAALQVVPCPNRGMDCGAWLFAMDRIFDGDTPWRDRWRSYEAVFKGHTKTLASQPPTWRRDLMKAVARSPARAAACVRVLRSRPSVSMLASGRWTLTEPPWRLGLMYEIARKLGMNPSHAGELSFVGGTIFWARFEQLCTPFARLPRRPADYMTLFPEGKPPGETEAHSFERLFGLLAGGSEPAIQRMPSREDPAIDAEAEAEADAGLMRGIHPCEAFLAEETIARVFTATAVIPSDVREHLWSIRNRAAECDAIVHISSAMPGDRVMVWGVASGLLRIEEGAQVDSSGCGGDRDDVSSARWEVAARRRRSLTLVRRRWGGDDAEDMGEVREMALAAGLGWCEAIRADASRPGEEPGLATGGCDMLILDGRIGYGGLRSQLLAHHTKVGRYIFVRDTISHGWSSELPPADVAKEAARRGCRRYDVAGGAWPAVEEFVAAHGDEWTIEEREVGGHGFVSLVRTGCASSALPPPSSSSSVPRRSSAPPPSSAPPSSSSSSTLSQEKRALILYAYFESGTAPDHLRFFCEHGIQPLPDRDYVVIINGRLCSAEAAIPTFANVRVIRRDNVGFDFGAWAHALRALEEDALLRGDALDWRAYRFCMMINSSTLGPLLAPREDAADWLRPFERLLVGRCALVGPTISDFEMFVPHVQSMCMAVSVAGLRAMAEAGVFDHSEEDERIVWDVVLRREIGASRAVMEAGHAIDALMPTQIGRSYSLAGPLGGKIPTGEPWVGPVRPEVPLGGVGRMLDPLELVFFKNNRGLLLEQVARRIAAAGFDRRRWCERVERMLPTEAPAVCFPVAWLAARLLPRVVAVAAGVGGGDRGHAEDDEGGVAIAVAAAVCPGCEVWLEEGPTATPTRERRSKAPGGGKRQTEAPGGGETSHGACGRWAGEHIARFLAHGSSVRTSKDPLRDARGVGLIIVPASRLSSAGAEWAARWPRAHLLVLRCGRDPGALDSVGRTACQLAIAAGSGGTVFSASPRWGGIVFASRSQAAIEAAGIAWCCRRGGGVAWRADIDAWSRAANGDGAQAAPPHCKSEKSCLPDPAEFAMMQRPPHHKVALCYAAAAAMRGGQSEHVHILSDLARRCGGGILDVGGADEERLPTHLRAWALLHGMQARRREDCPHGEGFLAEVGVQRTAGMREVCREVGVRYIELAVTRERDIAGLAGSGGLRMLQLAEGDVGMVCVDAAGEVGRAARALDAFAGWGCRWLVLMRPFELRCKLNERWRGATGVAAGRWGKRGPWCREVMEAATVGPSSSSPATREWVVLRYVRSGCDSGTGGGIGGGGDSNSLILLERVESKTATKTTTSEMRT
jgi:hypothetical protein